METKKDWRPAEIDGEREVTVHRGPGEEMMFYRSVAAEMIDLVQENCSRGGL